MAARSSTAITWRRLGWTLILVFFAFALVRLGDQPIAWQSIVDTMDWGWVALSLLMLATGQSVRGLMGWASSPSFGHALAPITSYRYWHLSQVAKYAPGGFWVFPARAVFYADEGMSKAVSGAVVLWEMLVVVFVGVAIAVLGGSGALLGGWGPIAAVVGALALLALLWSRRFWLLLANRNVKGADVVNAQMKQGAGARLRFATRPIIIATVSWLLIGVGFHFLLLAVNGGVTLSWFESTSRYASAWVLGFLVVFTPAGLGVREATLLLALTPVLGGSLAIAVALISRIWWSVVEAFHVLAAMTIGRMHRPVSEDPSG